MTPTKPVKKKGKKSKLTKAEKERLEHEKREQQIIEARKAMEEDALKLSNDKEERKNVKRRKSKRSWKKKKSLVRQRRRGRWNFCSNAKRRKTEIERKCKPNKNAWTESTKKRKLWGYCHRRELVDGDGGN